MDGRQGAIKSSLQFKLSAWLLLVILGIALLAGIFSFASAFEEANELQDDQLRQIGALVNHDQLPNMSGAVDTNVPDTDPESRVVIRVLPAPGASLGAVTPASGDAAYALPPNLPDGIQTVDLNAEPWRLFIRTLDSGTRIAVGQQTAGRDEIARNSALRTLMPFVILIPVLLLLVGNLIRQMFKPLKQLADDLDQRSENDLDAISGSNMFTEVRPFVVAINRLLARVAQSVALQRRFVADAAHELRSPLTALTLQAERLGATDLSSEARARLATLRRGLQRTRALLDQLLELARAQGPIYSEGVPVSTRNVFRQVLEDLLPLAAIKQIDLGMTEGADANINTREIDLKTLLKNLVDNAIRYTPQGGQVDLSVQTRANEVILQIEDTGPGIAEHEYLRVFDPFYRVLGNDEAGSGLGLSIVKTIADRIGAEIRLSKSGLQPNASGLRVSVIFSATSANAPPPPSAPDSAKTSV